MQRPCHLTRRRFLATLAATPALAAFGPRLLLPPRAAHARSLPGYAIEAEVDVDGGTLVASQTVTVQNRVGVSLDRVIFRVVPATVGSFALRAASVDGTDVPASLDGNIMTVTLPAPLDPGGSTSIGLQYAIRLSREPNRLAAAGRTIALGNWFPILAVHRGEWDRRQYTDVGDAFFTEVADYDVTISTSRPVEVAATGQLVDGSGTRWRFRAANVRDFAVTMSADYRVHEARAGEVAVRAYTADAARSRRLADRAVDFLRWLSDRFAPYPYPTLSIADVELSPSYAGMEYPALVMLSPYLSAGEPFVGGQLDALLLHEIVHQWFYSLVGNDQIADPWLDEAVTTYVTYLYYAENSPGLASGVFDRTIPGGGSAPVDSGVTEFPSDPPYFAVVYRRGARFLHALRERTGHDAFMGLLRQHVATHRDRVATPRAFLDRALAAAGPSAAPLIRDYFRYGAFAYPTPQTWTLEAPAIPWSRGADVFVGADFPVSRVELWLDQRRMSSGPENAVTLDLATVEAGEYVLLARVFNHEDAVFERTQRIEVG